MELTPHVQEKLHAGHKLTAVVEAGLVQEFIKNTRVLALIEVSSGKTKHGGDQALLIFQTARVPVHSAIDLTIEQIIPVDINLKCEIGSPVGNPTVSRRLARIRRHFRRSPNTSNTDVNTDVLVNVTWGKIKLLFEMPFSQRTNTFVSEILRAAENISKRRGPPPEFAWLRPYQQNSPSNTSDNELASPGTALPSSNSMDRLGDNSSLCDVSVDITSSSSPYPHPSSNNTDTSSLHEFCQSSPRPKGKSEQRSVTPTAEWFHDKMSSMSPHTVTNILSSTLGSAKMLLRQNDDERSPDLGVNRHSIAAGLSPTPIAARESHIKHQMALREDSYTDTHDFTVFVGTWNVNGRSPCVGLADWLSVDQEPPDVYAVGFQELDLNAENFLFNNTPKEQEWLNSVLNGIHPKAKYKKVRLVRLVGMMLIVLVQEKHAAYVRNVTIDTVGTGIMNKMGNKGAVAIRMDLNNTSICFVNSHLATHVEELERRNEDHDCIFQRICFNLNMNTNSPPKTIKDHDHIYFLGDLNYRINPCDHNIREVASSDKFQILLEHDQLIQQRNSKRVFALFKEGEITFKPTFKYDIDSDVWDTSEKQRDPAWCDRVMWFGDRITQLQYRSHPTLKISDHKPVSAIFSAGIKVIDTRRYRRIYEEVMKKLDKLENEFLPQVSVDATEIILDPVKFYQTQIKTLTIANTGQVPVQFEFIKKLNDPSFCKPWLTIRPSMNFMMPGEKCDVSIEVKVDKRTASQLNSGADQMYDILVLHLDGGKDLFITVIGEYERSCFGSSINALVHMNKPFRDIPLDRLIDLESKDPKSVIEMPYAVPKELWYLVDHLHSNALQSKGLFTHPGLQKELYEIRTHLDEGIPNDVLPGSVYSIAEALLLFLEALPEPVIPYNMYHEALEAAPKYSLCKDVISKLPDHHRNVFSYLMAFLKELLNHTDDNNLDTKTLALVFGSILMREHFTANSDFRHQHQITERRKQTFVLHFLMNDDE